MDFRKKKNGPLPILSDSEKGMKVGIVCCSNGKQPEWKEQQGQLTRVFAQMGLEPVYSECIFAETSVFGGTARERAKSLMDFYKDPEIRAIYDISGGDIANEVLPYLDFKIIRDSGKRFWGYSDLTTVINAIYTQTGNPSVLYQVRNLIYDHADEQIRNFKASVLEGNNDLYDVKYDFIQGEELRGVVVGGNIRCLLKLAGTKYWPGMEGKILLLESYGGTVPRMATYLAQLNQMGVFHQLAGIILGTFTAMEQQQCRPDIVNLVKTYTGSTLPIVMTREVGHGTDSKAIIMGKEVCIHGQAGTI